MIGLPYRSVILCDTEFERGGVEGNLSRPVCVVAKDYLTGREWRLRRGEFGATPPFPIGPESLVRRLLCQRRDWHLRRSRLAAPTAYPRFVH
jgi:hypothetical protein